METATALRCGQESRRRQARCSGARKGTLISGKMRNLSWRPLSAHSDRKSSFCHLRLLYHCCVWRQQSIFTGFETAKYISRAHESIASIARCNARPEEARLRVDTMSRSDCTLQPKDRSFVCMSARCATYSVLHSSQVRADVLWQWW